MARRQLNIHLTGKVQAVRLRENAALIARRRGLAGYAVNLVDGSLRIVVEGTEEALEGYLEDVIARSKFAHVDGQEVTKGPASGRYRYFRVRLASLKEELVLALGGGQEVLEEVVAGLGRVEGKLDTVNGKLDTIAGTTGKISGQLESMDKTLNSRFDHVDKQLEQMPVSVTTLIRAAFEDVVAKHLQPPPPSPSAPPSGA